MYLKKIGMTLCGLWGGLGAYRGHQLYNKNYQSKLEHYRKYVKHTEPEPKYYYTKDAAISVLSCLSYFSLLPIYDELHKLQNFIRKIL